MINIALTGFLTVSIKRPVIYYEYIFLPVVLILAQKHSIRTIILAGLIVLDFIYNLSHLYYFDFFNYVEKLPSIFVSKISFIFWIIIILFFAFFIWLCNYLIKLFEIKIESLEVNKLKLNLVLAIILFSIVYLIDSLNGSSLIDMGKRENPTLKIGSTINKPINIGKSLIKDIYTDYQLFKRGQKQVHEIPDFKNLNNHSSLSYQFFYDSKGEKEVLIILESWGLLKNKELIKEQLAPFYAFDSINYKIKFDSSYFEGATVQAESRELLNKEGEAYFSVINQNKCDIIGLIQKKNESNYKTMAVQSFPGSYSLGYKFNSLIGFQEFKEYKFFHDTLGKSNNYNNHYTSINDEEIFSYVFTNLPKNKKSFTYCLTINTHLPFALSKQEKNRTEFLNLKKKYSAIFPSEQTIERYYRMKQELIFLAQLIKNSEADRILIIGDHAPPFIFKEERKLYKPNLVPAIFIEKKK